MTTLQTGTKVLIEATVEQYNNDFTKVKINGVPFIDVHTSDLTVCETTEKKPAQWKVHKSDPDFYKLGEAMKIFSKEYIDASLYLGYVNGRPYHFTSNDNPSVYDELNQITGQQALKLLGVSELQKQHPGVVEPQQIEVGDVVRTYKFKDSPKLSYYPIMDSYNGIDRIVKSIDSKSNTVQFNDSENWWPLSSCALIHKGSTPSFKAGHEPTWTDEDIKRAQQAILCNHKDAVMNENFALEFLRPIPAQPTVESELDEIMTEVEKGKQSADWGAGRVLAWHQKHSGRVEVSVPSDEEIIKKWEVAKDLGQHGVYACIHVINQLKTGKE